MIGIPCYPLLTNEALEGQSAGAVLLDSVLGSILIQDRQMFHSFGIELASNTSERTTYVAVRAKCALEVPLSVP